MKIYETTYPIKTFYLRPELQDTLKDTLTVTVDYVKRIILIESPIKSFSIRLSLQDNRDPIAQILRMNKEQILVAMGCQKTLNAKQSGIKTGCNVRTFCKLHNMSEFDIQSKTYDKMMNEHRFFDDTHCFESMCEVIKEHEVLGPHANEIIEEVFLWPEQQETVVDLFIKYMFPIFETLPKITETNILISHNS